MILPYQRYRNTSGKPFQIENRLSEAFVIRSTEVVKLLSRRAMDHTTTESTFGYIVDCIEYTGIHKAHEYAWISENALQTAFTLEPYHTFKSQLEMFNWIWTDRMLESQLSGRNLIHPHNMQWHHQFLHILPKGSYPKWKLNPENILLALPEEHEHQERYPYFLELRQQLTLEYHQKYYK